MNISSKARHLALPKQARGFTLIEMVVTIILLGILGAAGVNMLYNPYATAKIVNATNTDAAKARYAMERVARELREVKSAGGSFCFSSQTASSVTFRKSGGGTDCSTGTQVTILHSGTNLLLNGQVLANNVASFSLTYGVAEIAIDLTVTDPESGVGNRQHSRVFLRNTST